MKKFFLVVVFIFSGWVSPANAAINDTPDFDPICWKRKECVAMTGNPGSAVPNEKPCIGGSKDEEWVKCLPAGITKTEIAFGGRDKFSDIGEFFKLNYNYAISIAGILAAIVIVVSGIQWSISAGNSEVITNSKKRIGSALIGLLIIYFSYAILYTVNKDTVNLRLPQVFMLRPFITASQFCKDMPDADKIKFGLAANSGESVDKSSYKEDNLKIAFKKIDFNTPHQDVLNFKKVFTCGKKMFFEKGSGQTCLAHVCDSFSTCDTMSSTPKCQPGFLSGKIGGMLSLAGAPVVDDKNNAKLLMMCNNGKIVELQDVDTKTEGKHYAFGAVTAVNIFNKVRDEVKDTCGGGQYPTEDGEMLIAWINKNIAGFYIGMEVNDEAGGVGGALPLNVEGGVFTSGVDDWHAIGRSAPGVCDINLAKVAIEISGDKSKDWCASNHNESLNCSCSLLSRLDFGSYVATKNEFTKYLFKFDELFSRTGGTICNVFISRSEFPAVSAPLEISETWGSRYVYQSVNIPGGKFTSTETGDLTNCKAFK